MSSRAPRKNPENWTTLELVQWIFDLGVNFRNFSEKIQDLDLTVDYFLEATEEDLVEFFDEANIPPPTRSIFKRELSNLKAAVEVENAAFKVTVTLLGGTSKVIPREFDLKPEMTVGRLKEIIFEQERETFKDCGYFFVTKELADDRATLSSLGITNNSRIEADRRSRGGHGVRADSTSETNDHPSCKLQIMNHMTALQSEDTSVSNEAALSRTMRHFGPAFVGAFKTESNFRNYFKRYNAAAVQSLDQVPFDLFVILYHVNELLRRREIQVGCLSFIFNPYTSEINDERDGNGVDSKFDVEFTVVDSEDAVFDNAMSFTRIENQMILTSFPFDKAGVYIFRNGAVFRVDRLNCVEFLMKMSHVGVGRVLNETEIVQVETYPDGHAVYGCRDVGRGGDLVRKRLTCNLRLLDEIEGAGRAYELVSLLEILERREYHSKDKLILQEFRQQNGTQTNGSRDLKSWAVRHSGGRIDLFVEGGQESDEALFCLKIPNLEDDVETLLFHPDRVERCHGRAGVKLNEKLRQFIRGGGEYRGVIRAGRREMLDHAKILCGSEDNICLLGAATSTRCRYGDQFYEVFSSCAQFCGELRAENPPIVPLRVMGDVDHLYAICGHLWESSRHDIRRLVGCLVIGETQLWFHVECDAHNRMQDEVIEACLGCTRHDDSALVLIVVPTAPNEVYFMRRGICDHVGRDEAPRLLRATCHASQGSVLNGFRIILVKHLLSGRVRYGVECVHSRVLEMRGHDLFQCSCRLFLQPD